MSLNLIEEAIEKVAKEKNNNTAAKAVSATALGAGAGAVGANLVRDHHIRKSINQLRDHLPKESIDNFKALARESYSKTPIRDTLKGIDEASKITKESPTLNKIKYLAGKKRVMAPIAAGLAGAGYLASRKRKDKK